MDEITEIEMSADITDLVTALAKAQSEMTGAVKSEKNEFLGSRYADLEDVWNDIRGPLTRNGLSLIQMPVQGINVVTLITQLSHSSGQWIRSRWTMQPAKQDPQGLLACVTYMRRGAASAMVGSVQVDPDMDGEGIVAGQTTGEAIDVHKVTDSALMARQLVDEDDEDYSKLRARELFGALTNDERLRFQLLLKNSSPEGTRKTYWSCFRDHLAKEKEWMNSNADNE